MELKYIVLVVFAVILVIGGFTENTRFDQFIHPLLFVVGILMANLWLANL